MFSEDEYRLDFFADGGFERRKCPSCGKFFWTRDAVRKTCGDPPCDPYTFIGAPVFKREHSLDEMREHYLSYFEARGHTRISRYPVVARWRDDIYLTIASIADFQPFVTSGQVPPPSNPLTISQPCIRLDDLDSVGRSGRHLTTFEMMAHHVFNTRSREIYWKDRTVQLCDDLFLGLGMDPLAVTYKENPWAGGGNAGPSVECMVAGLELATLVFMDLKATPGGPIQIKGESYSKMDNYIVDTGYGLERFVWASKGTPTIYDAIFPDLVRKVADLAGVEHNLKDPEYAEIFAQNARLAGMVDLDNSSMKEIREKIARNIGIPPEKLERIIAPMERVYAVVDHTRCLAFMLGDGIIPSNVKAGYLARLVIRRTLRQMKDLGIGMPLSELVEMQISRLDYPDWKERFPTISEILAQEEQKYAETLEKGRKLVKKTAQHFAKLGQPIPLKEMISLYDTHGIPPEIARESAEEQGATVELPDNFYSLVASSHLKSEQEEAKQVVIPGEKTELLFYDHPFDQVFEAKVQTVLEDGSIVLDKTLLYPEGGGQPADHGTLEKGGVTFQVLDVQKIGDIVLHKLEDELVKAAGGLNPGDRVTGRVDMRRRLAHARHHTATHLVHDSAKRVLGKHIWQAGAQKSEDRARLDLSHFKRITEQELKAIELEANRRVMEVIPVDTQFLPRSEAEKIFGFELYQGGVPPGNQIRVVKVGSDIEACAGTHVTNTGMIGAIKILHTERIQDGVERIEFAAGEAAVRASQQRDDLLSESASVLRVPTEQLPKTAGRFFEEWKGQQKEIEELNEKLAIANRNSLRRKAERSSSIDELNVISGVVHDFDSDALIKTSSLLSQMGFLAVLVDIGGKFVVSVSEIGLSKGIRANDIAKEIAKSLNGRGGGKPELAQGVITRLDNLENDLNETLALYLGIPYLREDTLTGTSEEKKQFGQEKASFEEAERSNKVLLQGMDYWHKGLRDKAIEYLNRSIEINPENELAWIKKGIVLGKLDEPGKAIESFKKAIELKPENAEAYLNLGVASGQIGNFDEAYAAIDKAIKLKPNYANGWFNKAVFLTKQSCYDEAIKCFGKAIEIDSKDAMALFGKSVALSKLDRVNEAIECLDRAIKIKPSYEAAKTKRNQLLSNSNIHNSWL